MNEHFFTAGINNSTVRDVLVYVFYAVFDINILHHSSILNEMFVGPLLLLHGTDITKT